MCLVQVEKAPKPLPACATPATEGMKAWTHSDLAVKAQQSVMSIPADQPSARLPDLRPGRRVPVAGSRRRVRRLGIAVSRAQARRLPQEPGPLIADRGDDPLHPLQRAASASATEIAGVMELGMVGRGEHAEIVSFVGKTVDSELSGNSIDLCPVGALTSKPFRYAARRGNCRAARAYRRMTRSAAIS